MAAGIKAEALIGEGCAVGQELWGTALVAALELALLAAHHLLADLDTGAGRHAEAAAHLDRALALPDASGAPHERARALLALAGLVPPVGAPAAARAWAGGGRAGCPPCDAAPAPALAEIRGWGATTHTRAAPGYCAGLTRREAEVLRLLAAGRSNRETAAALSLSIRTVERHITNLYRKIEARGRADATAYALRHRLA